MAENFYDQILAEGINRLVFLGEAGSGKTTLAVSCARELARRCDKSIHLIDMDQSKHIYRAREAADSMKEDGICFHSGPKFLDSPLVPEGMNGILEEKDNIVICDIGGNQIGSVNMGQYASYFQNESSRTYFLMNCYRAFSDTTERVQETLASLSAFSGLSIYGIICNPNFGKETTAEDILSGLERTEQILQGVTTPVVALMYEQTICDLAQEEAIKAYPLVPVSQMNFY